MTIMMLMVLIMMMATVIEGRRVPMIQSQACYYQPHNRELVCQCSEDNSYLHLNLREFVQARQEVSE